MARTLVSSGSTFEADIGYSRAVVDGDWIFVSGTTGFDYATMTISEDVVVQCRQAMRNVASALSQAGGSISDIVRVPTSCRSEKTSSRAGRCSKSIWAR